MQKFTIFTIILTVITVVVAGELVFEEYLPSLTNQTSEEKTANLDLPDDLDLNKVIETNVFGSGLSNTPEFDNPAVDTSELVYEEVPILGFGSDMPALDEIVIPTEMPEAAPFDLPSASLPVYNASSADAVDFEDEGFNDVLPSAYIREDMLHSAGFASATLAEEDHNGFLFKSIYLSDLLDVEATKYFAASGETLLAKIYVIEVGALSSIHEVYEVLKVRAGEGLDIEVNETNEFGDGSFYMNDARRSNVAFLLVRFGPLLYGFSYPKDYHAQVKNLTKLIDYEF